MSVCDPYRELELYLEQANLDITEVFNKWAADSILRRNDQNSTNTVTTRRNNNDSCSESPVSTDSSPVYVTSTTLTGTSGNSSEGFDTNYKPILLSDTDLQQSDEEEDISINTPYVDNELDDNYNEYRQLIENGASLEFGLLFDAPRAHKTPSPRRYAHVYDPNIPYLFTPYPLTARYLRVIFEHLDAHDQLQTADVHVATQQLLDAFVVGELTQLVSFATTEDNTDIFSKEAEMALDRAIVEGDVAGGFADRYDETNTSPEWEMFMDIIRRIVPLSKITRVNKQQLAEVLVLRANLRQFILFDIEATEACRWLRAAGFPQYAQLYESNQFPVEIAAVEQDHPQLEASVLASLFRRLHVLNRCARLHQQKNSQQQSDWDDEECALSANWIYQSDVRRWSRVGRDLDIPNVGSKDWQKLQGLANSAMNSTDPEDPNSITLTPTRERDNSNQQQQPRILRAGSAKIRRHTLNRDPFDSSPISNNSTNNSTPAVSVLDMLSQQLRSLNTSQSSVNEVGQGQAGQEATSTVSLAVADAEGAMPRTGRRSKTRSLDKCDLPGMPSCLAAEKYPHQSLFRLRMPSAPMFSLRSAWQSHSRAAAAADILEERLELEEGGRPISSLSCTQLHVLRKLALLKLTAYMERFCPGHRTGWNWDLPKVLLRNKPKPKDKEKEKKKESDIFGISLNLMLQRTGFPIPKCIEVALEWLAVHGKDQLGIFRRSGVKSRIAALRDLMEERGHNIDFSAFQVYDIADLVKQYFRELPDALMTNKLSETFILIIQHVPLNLRRESFLCAIMLMPDEHHEVLRILLHFLRDLAQSSEVHNMNLSNLAVCFGPSLFHYQPVPTSRQGLGQPHEKELNESTAAHRCLTYMLENIENVFSIPKELLQQCKGDEIKESAVLHLSQLGADCNGNWRSYLQECQNALMREVREKNRGWLAVQPHNPKVEMAYKKVADGHPLRLWRISAEVEAPPVEVLHRILRERHVWDDDLEGMRIVEIIDSDTEVHQYHRRSIRPLPVEDYCVIRMWKSDLLKGACMIVETSVEHDDAVTIPNSVRGIVLASRYLIEPGGSGKSKVVHLVRVDTRGRMPEWFQKNYGHMCAVFLANLQNSFRKTAGGPESNV